jgi:hypothetical protein
MCCRSSVSLFSSRFLPEISDHYGRSHRHFAACFQPSRIRAGWMVIGIGAVIFVALIVPIVCAERQIDAASVVIAVGDTTIFSISRLVAWHCARW